MRRPAARAGGLELTSPSHTTALVRSLFRELDQLSASVSYRGYEFDDFLDSPIVRVLSFRNLFLQRALIQAGERLPVNLRFLLRINKHSSTKANGLFARGVA